MLVEDVVSSKVVDLYVEELTQEMVESGILVSKRVDRFVVQNVVSDLVIINFGHVKLWVYETNLILVNIVDMAGNEIVQNGQMIGEDRIEVLVEVCKGELTVEGKPKLNFID